MKRNASYDLPSSKKQRNELSRCKKHYILGKDLYEKMEKEKAHIELTAAFELGLAQDLMTNYLLGKILLDMNCPFTADVYFERALGGIVKDRNDKSPQIMDLKRAQSRAWTEGGIGSGGEDVEGDDNEEMWRLIESMQRAVNSECNENLFELYFTMGNAYAYLRNNEKSRKSYGQAVAFALKNNWKSCQRFYFAFSSANPELHSIGYKIRTFPKKFLFDTYGDAFTNWNLLTKIHHADILKKNPDVVKHLQMFAQWQKFAMHNMGFIFTEATIDIIHDFLYHL